MALKLKIAKLEDVEEQFRTMYVQDETDKQFYLDVDGVDEHPLMIKTKNNEQAARRAERALKADIDRWTKLGKSEAEIVELIEKAEKDALTEAEKKGEWEKLRTQMNEKHQQDLKKEQEKTEAERQVGLKYRSQLERHLVDSKATAAIAAAEGEPELLVPLVKRFMKVVQDENGEFRTEIVDDKGGPRVNGKGEPLSIDELVTEMRASEKLGRAFKASGSSGGGSQPGGGSNPKTVPAGVPKTWQEAKTPEDKAKFIAHQKTQTAA